MPGAHLRFAAIGDVSLGDHPLCTGFGGHSRFKSEPAGYPFEFVRPLFREVDLLFGNCECTLSQIGLTPGDYRSMQMRGQPSYAADLAQAGFGIMNVANNHSQQHGHRAFLDSVSLLESEGIRVCGLRADCYRRSLPVVVTRNELTVTFLAYSLRPRQYFDDEPLYAEGYRDEILDDVRASRHNDRCLVVSLHWGDEFIDYPSPDEIALAHDIVDAGANLVLGHHPHVLRGVERYGRGYILYSLGNFVCDMLWDERMRESVIFTCVLGRGNVRDVELVPVRIGDDYRPVPLHGDDAFALRLRLLGLTPGSSESPMPSAEDYPAVARAALREERRKAHRYFLRNLSRFPIGILRQQFVTYFRNRLAERLAGLRPAGRN